MRFYQTIYDIVLDTASLETNLGWESDSVFICLYSRSKNRSCFWKWWKPVVACNRATWCIFLAGKISHSLRERKELFKWIQEGSYHILLQVKLLTDFIVRTMVEPRRRCFPLPAVDLGKKAVSGTIYVTVISATKLSRNSFFTEVDCWQGETAASRFDHCSYYKVR